MNATKLWYPHHIEKYRRKTGHLTLAEHGAYRLLMDWYWDRRGPLPAKEDRLRRYLRADCREWKKIREEVLALFVLADDGYHDFDIDAELRRENFAPRSTAERLSACDLFAAVFFRDGGSCVYCDDREGPFELDHIIPKSRGGSDGVGNLCLACKPCNASKKARTPKEWLSNGSA